MSFTREQARKEQARLEKAAELPAELPPPPASGGVTEKAEPEMGENAKKSKKSAKSKKSSAAEAKNAAKEAKTRNRPTSPTSGAETEGEMAKNTASPEVAEARKEQARKEKAAELPAELPPPPASGGVTEKAEPEMGEKAKKSKKSAKSKKSSAAKEIKKAAAEAKNAAKEAKARNRAPSPTSGAENEGEMAKNTASPEVAEKSPVHHSATGKDVSAGNNLKLKINPKLGLITLGGVSAINLGLLKRNTETLGGETANTGKCIEQVVEEANTETLGGETANTGKCIEQVVEEAIVEQVEEATLEQEYASLAQLCEEDLRMKQEAFDKASEDLKTLSEAQLNLPEDNAPLVEKFQQVYEKTSAKVKVCSDALMKAKGLDILRCF